MSYQGYQHMCSQWQEDSTPVMTMATSDVSTDTEKHLLKSSSVILESDEQQEMVI